MKKFQTKVALKIKHILCLSDFFPPKFVPFMRQCGKKYFKVGQATDDNIQRATDAHSGWVILIAFPQKQ